MIVLEIILVIIGIGAVFLSFNVTDSIAKKKGANPGGLSADASDRETASDDGVQKEAFYGLSSEEKEKLIEEQREKLHEMANEISYDTEDRLSSMSNEKIMGFSEYSDQVFDKMEKNHAETVFLYDMLNEKEKEIKRLVHEADVAKTNLHDELLKEYQERKGYGNHEFGMSDDVSYNDVFAAGNAKKTDVKLSADSGFVPDKITVSDSGEEFYDIPSLDNDLQDDDMVYMDDIADSVDMIPMDGDEEDIDGDRDVLSMERTSLYDAEIARIEQEEKKSRLINTGDTDVEDDRQPIFTPQVDMNKSKNDIVSMYKEGKTVLEISKILSVGQGEVKLVIDMYRARKG